jgi:hypothetical protein
LLSGPLMEKSLKKVIFKAQVHRLAKTKLVISKLWICFVIGCVLARRDRR